MALGTYEAQLTGPSIGGASRWCFTVVPERTALKLSRAQQVTNSTQGTWVLGKTDANAWALIRLQGGQEAQREVLADGSAPGSYALSDGGVAALYEVEGSTDFSYSFSYAMTHIRANGAQTGQVFARQAPSRR
ncbi:hypothetical protein [Deinococcus hopiensis]|uniref:Uncharacterized protein n=1 Tax=Deinococcus hopiensis KR-140 TaxID=695939 RepID=A0A1W1VI23_9DEIO|nr:hypothetical protein [Deinococcus hopiensis]SMB92701.1 hypothetical protein SAMN00790413_01691 [Deinococcus hopiensis KR-140]